MSHLIVLYPIGRKNIHFLLKSLELREAICHFSHKSVVAAKDIEMVLRMSRPLFADSYLQVTCGGLSANEKEGKTASNDNKPEIVTGLHIRKNVLGVQGINESTPVILTLTNITDLDLSHSGLHVDGSSDQNTVTALQQIANICGHLTKLKKLDLTGNFIKLNVCTILRRLQSRLTHLALGDCGVQDSDLREMCTMETLGHLQSLKLNGSGYGRSHEVFSAFVLKSAATLKFLSAENTHFTSASIAPLFQLVRKLPLLKTLSLSFRNLLPDDIGAFKEEFPTLEIVNTYYTKEQLMQLADILKKN